jgi:hypothetical protein
MIFPAVLIFWAVRRIGKHQAAPLDEQKIGQKSKEEETKLSSSYSISTVSSIWILLLSISMILSATGDIGFAYKFILYINKLYYLYINKNNIMGPDTVLRDIWIWNIIFNADHLCLAGALIGYRHFFSFRTPNILQY